MPDAQDPKVSIVVPCFNGGRFLDGLLQSLALQSFRDFELIVVDDGSTDPLTVEVIAGLPSRVRVIRQPNQGLAAARNRGISEIKGDYVLPLDCDDRLAPSFLMRTCAVLDRSAETPYVFTDMASRGNFDVVLKRSFNRFDQLFLNTVPYCCLFRRSVLKEAGGYDASMRDGYEDWELNVRLVAKGRFGKAIHEPLFFYWVGQEGMLLSHSAKQHARLWRAIRDRHVALYRIPSVFRLWQLAREKDEPGRICLPIALLALLAARVLPDSATSSIYFRALKWRHRRHLARDRAKRASASLRPDHRLTETTAVGKRPDQGA